MDLSLTQIGLLCDVVGFIIIFFFGGFQFGIDTVTLGKSSWYVMPARIIGSVLIIGGFILQIFGAN